VWHVLAPTAGAHFGASAYLFVVEDSVMPGATFTLVASDVSPAASVSFELLRGEYAADLGTITAGPDGHFQTSLTMPEDAPNGYVELIGRSPDGTSASTFVLVGPRTPETGSPPAVARPGGIDPSLIVLGILLIGSIGAVVYVLFKRRQPAPEQVAVAPRRLPSKKRRRT
jgi:hypothetical protein